MEHILYLTPDDFRCCSWSKLESDIAYTQIYCKAKKSITIIDRYLGVKTLDLLRDVAKRVLIKIISDARCEGL